MEGGTSDFLGYRSDLYLSNIVWSFKVCWHAVVGSLGSILLRKSFACMSFFQLVLHLDVWYTYALFFMLMISKEVGHEGGYREVFWEKVDIVFKDMLPCLLKI